jgi:hypothetical protein
LEAGDEIDGRVNGAEVSEVKISGGLDTDGGNGCRIFLKNWEELRYLRQKLCGDSAVRGLYKLQLQLIKKSLVQRSGRIALDLL